MAGQVAGAFDAAVNHRHDHGPLSVARADAEEILVADQIAVDRQPMPLPDHVARGGIAQFERPTGEDGHAASRGPHAACGQWHLFRFRNGHAERHIANPLQLSAVAADREAHAGQRGRRVGAVGSHPKPLDRLRGVSFAGRHGQAVSGEQGPRSDEHDAADDRGLGADGLKQVRQTTEPKRKRRADPAAEPIPGDEHLRIEFIAQLQVGHRRPRLHVDRDRDHAGDCRRVIRPRLNAALRDDPADGPCGTEIARSIGNLLGIGVLGQPDSGLGQFEPHEIAPHGGGAAGFARGRLPTKRIGERPLHLERCRMRAEGGDKPFERLGIGLAGLEQLPRAVGHEGVDLRAQFRSCPLADPRQPPLTPPRLRHRQGGIAHILDHLFAVGIDIGRPQAFAARGPGGREVAGLHETIDGQTEHSP